jgi:hypothetical protein
LGTVVALGALALLMFGLRYQSERAPEEAPAPPSAPQAPAAAGARPAETDPAGPTPALTSAPVASVVPPVASADNESVLAGEDLPLPADAGVAPGQGLLDVETGGREAIWIDGAELGRGPFLRLTLTPGVHEVRLRDHGEERIRSVLVQSMRRTRLPLSAVWTQ